MCAYCMLISLLCAMVQIRSTMSKKASRRRPVKVESLAGVTVSIQNCRHRDYRFAVVIHAEGKRKVRYVRTEAEAKALAQTYGIQATNHGIKHGEISDAERSAIIAFRDAIAKLPEDDRPTLADAVSAYLEANKKALKPISVNELVTIRIKAAVKDKCHERTIRDLIGTDGRSGRLGLFAATFGEREAAYVTAQEVEDWSRDYCARAEPEVTEAGRREILVRIRGLFAVGVPTYFAKNEMDKLDIPDANPARAAILTPEQADRLMLNLDPEILPAVAVQLFGGLRKSEADRLRWEDIFFERKEMRVTQRKGVGNERDRVRFVTMPETLVIWLERHRRPGGWIMPIGTKGAISAQIYRKKFAKARTVAKISHYEEHTLRHSYGTYLFTETGNLAKCMAAMGHTREHTFLEHYNRGVSSAEAAKFWAVLPQASKNKIVAMPKAAR